MSQSMPAGLAPTDSQNLCLSCYITARNSCWVPTSCASTSSKNQATPGTGYNKESQKITAGANSDNALIYDIRYNRLELECGNFGAYPLMYTDGGEYGCGAHVPVSLARFWRASRRDAEQKWWRKVSGFIWLKEPQMLFCVFMCPEAEGNSTVKE